MNTFNMKQWLQENRVGPYNKCLLTEDSETREDMPADDMSQEMPTDEARMPFKRLQPDEEKYQIIKDEKGSITQATNEDGITLKVGDMALEMYGPQGKKPMEILGFKGEQGKVKAICNAGTHAITVDIDGLTKKLGEDMGVGYVMKTKDSEGNII